MQKSLKPRARILRARFSAVTPQDIKAALER
jgi:hypothetical protein